MQMIVAGAAAEVSDYVPGDSDPKAQSEFRSPATSAIGLAALSLVPDQLGRSKRGGPTITSQMRDTVNRRRAACKFVSVLHDSASAAILGRQPAAFNDRLSESVSFAENCAEELVAYFSRWGVSTLTGALSTLTRIRCFAEAEAEYDAVDSDVYSAQLASKFLDSIHSAALAKAQKWQSNAEASGMETTEQQRRRDGRSAAKTAFRSLRFLLDNAKMDTAARDPLVCKRKFATTTPIPTPAAEPYHYAQLCYLAAHSHDPVVAETAGGFALVASQTSRYKQAQACTILGEKGGVLFTGVQLDKSNEPHKQQARPAFGPLLDAYGYRGVIDAVYAAIEEVPEGCFLVRDNDSQSGAPVPGSGFTNGPLLGGRADAALQYLMTLPPLSFSFDKVANIKVHSLKPFMLKHAARMRIDPVRRHGLGRFAGSAAQHQSLIPDRELLVRHRIRCSQLPDRYAQNAAMRDVNHFIDNTVALSGLVHGYARKLDLARMVNAFHLQMAGLRANAYYEFVPSLANLADLPSRNEFELLEQLGGRHVDVVFPPAADWLGPLRRWFTRFAEQ